jgi:glycosyltransferase involved in cell wall biosynthesis
MPRIIFVNRFYYPDQSATSQIATSLAESLASAGEDVHAVCGMKGLYAEEGGCLRMEEVARGVTIHRVRSSNMGRKSILGRVVDYVTFLVLAALAVFRLARQGDIVVAKTDPPLLCVALLPVIMLRGARLINWLQDVYPEIAIRLKVPFIAGPIGTALIKVRNIALRKAAANVVIGTRMAEYLRSLHVPPQSLHVVSNWADEAIIPVAPENNPLRQAWGLKDKFVIAYSGNMGRAHEYDTLLDAAEQVQNKRILFLFIGGGNHVDQLKSSVRARSLEHMFQFKPYQDRESLSLSLGVADVHWLSLRPEMEGLIVPSKFFGIAAAARPVIAVADQDGEVAGLVRAYDLGAVVAVGDGAQLAMTIDELAIDPDRVLRAGKRARAMYEQVFSLRQATAAWADILSRLPSSLDKHAAEFPADARRRVRQP